MRALLLCELPRTERRERANRKLIDKFLGKEESSLLSILETRRGLSDEAPTGGSRPQPRDEYRELEERTNKLIDETIADLRALRKEPGSAP
jgi:hypothetical protein